jgi:hexosaminidase
MYDKLNYNYSKCLYDITIETNKNSIDSLLPVYKLKSGSPYEIRYTVNGKNPGKSDLLYKSEIYTDTSFLLKAQTFHNGNPIGNIFQKRIYPNKAFAKKTWFTYAPNTNYSRDTLLLTDGIIRSSENNYSSAMAWSGKNAEIIIDFGKEKAKTKSYTLFLIFDYKNEIYLPHHIDILSSPDKKVFYDIALNKPIYSGKGRIRKIHFSTRYPSENRYLKIVLHNPDQYPDTKRAGYPDRWILVDEVIVQ